jgi:5-methyltetrahydrofolate--homocysteine methyltransferase
VIIIGEKINMSRKPVAKAWEQRHASYITRLAKEQAEAGASYIDVNGGLYGEEAECMEWLLSVVQDAVDLPISIDTTHPGALEKALGKVKQPPLVNSVSGEKERLGNFLPLLRGVDCKVVALLMSDEGLPKTVDDRMRNATFLIDKLIKAGFGMDQIFVDPCVVPVASDPEGGKNFLASLPTIRGTWPGIHLIGAVSNVSFGLPLRSFINRTFLVMCIVQGMDAAILDPTDPEMHPRILASKALLGSDPYCMNYLKAFRKGILG